MHTRKRDKSKPIEMQDLAGSAKLTDLADNVLAIAKCNATEVYVKVLKSRSNAIPDKVRHFEIRSDGYLHLEFIRECEEEDLHKDSEESSADAIKDAQFPDNAA